MRELNPAQDISDDLNEVLNSITGIADANLPSGFSKVIWVAGCGYCWDEEERRWKRCCIA